MDQSNTVEMNWKKIKDYLLNSEECKKLHKMVWDGEAYITLRNGRHRITGHTPFEQLKALIKNQNFA